MFLSYASVIICFQLQFSYGIVEETVECYPFVQRAFELQKRDQLVSKEGRWIIIAIKNQKNNFICNCIYNLEGQKYFVFTALCRRCIQIDQRDYILKYSVGLLALRVGCGQIDGCSYVYFFFYFVSMEELMCSYSFYLFWILAAR